MPPGDLGERLAEPGRTGVFAGEGGIRETGDQGRPRPQCLHLGFTPTTSPRPLPLSPRDSAGDGLWSCSVFRAFFDGL